MISGASRGLRAATQTATHVSIVAAALACSPAKDNEQRLRLPEAGVVDVALAWEIDGAQLAIGDEPVAVETSTGDFVIGDARIGHLSRVDRTGNVLGPLVTPGNGPGQATPPLSLAVDGDSLYLTSVLHTVGAVVSMSLRDRGSHRWSYPAERDAGRFTPVACGERGCVVRRGAAWSVGASLQRPGESVVDSTAYGWLDTRAARAEVSWLFTAPNRRVVAFDWPGGPIPFASGGHEFDLGTQVILASGTVWWLDTATGRLGRWRAGAYTPQTFETAIARPSANVPAIEDTTQARLRAGTTDLDRKRLRATRDIRYLEGGLLPATRTLLPLQNGGVGIEVFTDGMPVRRTYLLVDDTGNVRDTVLVPGAVQLLAISDSLAVGYDAASDRLRAFRWRER